ncbi:MAG: DUF2917 domain-containing protein [Syntrophobacteraceae bacterium]|nr:DUF2917 domain-containing protein [Desulfobacteraceae bacterium]
MLCAGECEIRRAEYRRNGFLARVLQRCFGFVRGDAREENERGFVWAFRSGTTVLNRGEMCVVYLTGRCRFSCDGGAAWVTRSGDSRDYILGTGEDLILEGGGKVVVSGGEAGTMVRIRNA